MSCRKITLPLSLSLAHYPTTALQVHSSVGGEYRYVTPASPLITLTITVYMADFTITNIFFHYNNNHSLKTYCQILLNLQVTYIFACEQL